MEIETTRTEIGEASRLSPTAKILYGVGEVANAIKTVTFSLFSMFYVTVVLGLPGTWMGNVGLAAMVWDAVIDPYIGHLTDGEHAGERRFRFMLTGALTMFIGYVAFFSPPAGLSPVPLCAWLLAANLLMRTSASLFSIPYYAIGANLSDDYHERTSIAGVRGLVSGIGAIAIASLSFIVFFPQRSDGIDPKLRHDGYNAMGVTCGILMTAAALTAVLATSRMRRRSARSSNPARERPKRFGVSIRESLKNSSFRIMLISIVLIIVGLSVNSALALYFLQFFVRMTDSAALGGLQAAFFGAGLLGLVFWLRVSTKFEKHHLYILSSTVSAVIIFAGLFLFGEGGVFGSGDAKPLLVCYGLAGFFLSVFWFIPQSMLADIADESEALTGLRCDSSTFGAFSFALQVATGAGILLAGVMLDVFVGIQAGASQQTDESVLRIGVLYSAVPAILFLAGAVVMGGYDLTRTRMQTIRTKLREA